MALPKTKIRYLQKAIMKNGVSFFTVAFIAAVSIAIYLGMQSATHSILLDADRYFRDNRLPTMEFSCANGITEEDVDALADLPEVDLAEGGYGVTVLADLPEEQIHLRVFSRTAHINVPVVLEGTLPAAENEAAIEEMLAKQADLQVGDTLTLSHDGCLRTDTFRITAIIAQPNYCCATSKDSRGTAAVGFGAAERYITVTKDAFDPAYFGNAYTTAWAVSDALASLYYYDSEYAAEEDALMARLSDFCVERAALRYDELYELAAPAISAGLMPEDAVVHKEWLCMGRSEMGDLLSVQGLVESVNGISYSMSLVFLLVAIVVCHSAISRMIDEERTLIGAQKSLGAGSGSILFHYLAYNILCAVLGIILGWLLSMCIIGPIVVSILSKEFLLGSIPLAFVWKEAWIAGGLCLAIFVLTTLTTCTKLVKNRAIELLRGETPGQNKHFFFEHWKPYRRMSLYTRAMVKNILHDPGRMMSTIVGVVGCISLLVICISLKLAIDGAFDKQYDAYFRYDARLEFNESLEVEEDFAAALEAEGVDFLPIRDKIRGFRVNGGKFMNAHVVSMPDGEAQDFMLFQDAETGETLPLPTDGILISRKCAEVYGLEKGDTIDVMDVSGTLHPLRVAGVIEHYLQYHLFVTADSYYEKAMDEAADASVFLLRADPEALRDILRPMTGFLSLKDNSDQAENTDSIYMAIAVFFVLSIAMALLVLLNQLVMHIKRKARELAVMRINGYTLRETKAYIYKDNIVLTVLGLILGSGVGALLSYIVIIIMEREPSCYIHTPQPAAYIIACTLGALFALGVNLIALRRIDNLNLTNVSSN